MPLNCPQRGENLRLPEGGGRKPRRNRGRWFAAIILLLVAACLIAAYVLFIGTPPQAQPRPTPQVEQAAPQPAPTPIAEQPPTPTEPPPFCQRDFAAVAARQNDIAALQAAGGLVQLLSRNKAAPPYECAAFYLSQGLDVNAVGADGMTALHYAIKANQTKMLQFVIAHGADLKKKAGAKQLEPMGYAYYLALNNPKINRNKVIAILNDALVKQEQQQKQPQ